MHAMIMASPVERLVSSLSRGDIPWCHWKSNRHLDAALRGRTDLDLLFPEDRRKDVESALAEAGARRFQPVSFRDYPGIEDYLAVDPSGPILVHFHVHFRLLVGERNIKAHSLPWEAEVLASRVPSAPGSPIFVSSPEMELLLLIVRICVKQPRGALRLDPDGGAALELGWLRERVDGPAFSALAGRLLGADAAAALRAVLDEGDRRIEGARPQVITALAPHRRLSAAAEARLRRERGWALRLTRRARRAGLPVAARRIRPRRGFAVALLGCDGSGKSSLTKAAADFFAQKLDVERIYFGHGAGSRSALLRLALAARRRFGRSASLRRLLDVPVAAAIGLDKVIGFVRLSLARRAGMLVVCDRFPQAAVAGTCDGPRLPVLAAGNALAGTLLRPFVPIERAIYRIGERCAPDLVLKIRVSPAVAAARKSDGTSLETITRKVGVIDELSFGEGVVVTEIQNEGIPFEEAARRVVAAIWNTMGDAAD